MTTQYLKSPLALLFALILFTSCNAGELNKKAEATAAAFYHDLQIKDFQAALSRCSNKAFSSDPKEYWLKGFEKNDILLGKLRSFAKTSGFNIATSTSGGTTVSIAYDLQWQYGKSKDSVLLVEEKDGSMKIYGYRWQHTETQYLLGITASEKMSIAYMDAVKNGNYDDALSLCSNAALLATPKPQWEAFFQKAIDQVGPISSFSVVKDSSFYNIAATGNSGKGNYYDIYIKTVRNNTEVMEKIVFFQKSYDEPVKLAGHFFL